MATVHRTATDNLPYVICRLGAKMIFAAFWLCCSAFGFWLSGHDPSVGDLLFVAIAIALLGLAVMWAGAIGVAVDREAGR